MVESEEPVITIEEHQELRERLVKRMAVNFKEELKRLINRIDKQYVNKKDK